MNTILVVEDNLNQQLLYQIELEEEGYRVVVASDGREALEKVRIEQPNLVVLDLSMQGMDGIEALERMRLMNTRFSPRVIIHSAYEGCKDNYITKAADAYLIKSSDLDELKGEIQRVLLAQNARRRNAQLKKSTLNATTLQATDAN